MADEPLVEVVELFDQRVDARLIEPQRLHLGDDLFLEPLVLALLRRRQRLVVQLVVDVLVLQSAQALIRNGERNVENARARSPSRPSSSGATN